MNQNVEAFRTAVNQNPELQREITDLIESTQAIDYKAISELAKRHNYSFTEQEAMQLMASNDELSDFELEMVAAGSPTNCNGGATSNV